MVIKATPPRDAHEDKSKPEEPLPDSYNDSAEDPPPITNLTDQLMLICEVQASLAKLAVSLVKRTPVD